MPSDTAANQHCPRLWAEIDLDAIVHNYNVIRSRIGTGVRLMAMVKSNAYGHGAVPVARVLQHAGADCFGVANVEEAVELRAAGIISPVVITGPVTPCEVETAVANQIQMTVTPPEILYAIEMEAVRQQRTVLLHLMIDIGMTRCGLDCEDAIELAAHIKAAPALELAGVAAHFPMAEDAQASRRHLGQFTAACNKLRELGLLTAARHAANTVAIFNLPEAHFEMVRPGIGLYGLYPDECLRKHAPLKPAMTVRTQVSYVRSVPKGTPVGYAHTWRTKSDTVIATLPIGYADGFRRTLSNRGRVIIAGQYANVIGNVSMDMITVDAGGITDVRTGMPATIIGREGDAEITAEEHAGLCGTIPYEIVCLIGRRVGRTFKQNRRSVELENDTVQDLTPRMKTAKEILRETQSSLRKTGDRQPFSDKRFT